jgi:hypothetical protein
MLYPDTYEGGEQSISARLFQSNEDPQSSETDDDVSVYPRSRPIAISGRPEGTDGAYTSSSRRSNPLPSGSMIVSGSQSAAQRRRRRGTRTQRERDSSYPASFPRGRQKYIRDRDTGVQSEPEDLAECVIGDAFAELLEAVSLLYPFLCARLLTLEREQVKTFSSMSPRTRRDPLPPLVTPSKPLSRGLSPGPSSTTLSGADIPTSFYASRASLGPLSDEQTDPALSRNVPERSESTTPGGPKSNSWFDFLSYHISIKVWQCVGFAGLLLGVGFGMGYVPFSKPSQPVRLWLILSAPVPCVLAARTVLCDTTCS